MRPFLASRGELSFDFDEEIWMVGKARETITEHDFEFGEIGGSAGEHFKGAEAMRIAAVTVSGKREGTMDGRWEWKCDPSNFHEDLP